MLMNDFQKQMVLKIGMFRKRKEEAHLLGRDKVDAEADVHGFSFEDECFQLQCVATLQVDQLGS